MRKNIFKVLILVFVSAVGMLSFIFVAHSDDRTVNHVHIRGKITTPEGTPVEGVAFDLPRIGPDSYGFLTGLPDDAVCDIKSGIPGQGNNPRTTASGQYEIVVEITTNKYIQNVGVDKSKMAGNFVGGWHKPNYKITPK